MMLTGWKKLRADETRAKGFSLGYSVYLDGSSADSGAIYSSAWVAPGAVGNVLAFVMPDGQNTPLLGMGEPPFATRLDGWTTNMTKCGEPGPIGDCVITSLNWDVMAKSLDDSLIIAKHCWWRLSMYDRVMAEGPLKRLPWKMKDSLAIAHQDSIVLAFGVGGSNPLPTKDPALVRFGLFGTANPAAWENRK